MGFIVNPIRHGLNDVFSGASHAVSSIANDTGEFAKNGFYNPPGAPPPPPTFDGLLGQMAGNPLVNGQGWLGQANSGNPLAQQYQQFMGDPNNPYGNAHQPSNWQEGPGYNGPNGRPPLPQSATYNPPKVAPTAGDAWQPASPPPPAPGPTQPLAPPTGGWTGQYAQGLNGHQVFEDRRNNSSNWQTQKVVAPNDPNHPGVQWAPGAGGQWTR